MKTEFLLEFIPYLIRGRNDRQKTMSGLGRLQVDLLFQTPRLAGEGSLVNLSVKYFALHLALNVGRNLMGGLGGENG